MIGGYFGTPNAPDYSATPAALLTTRDAIVGTWRRPTSVPAARGFESHANLKLWGPRERADVADFDLHSRLGLAFDSGSGATATFFHVSHQATSAGLPTMSSVPLARFTRPDPAQFLDQLEYVISYADLRADRASEIFAQMGIAEAFFSAIAPLNSVRSPKTTELVVAALRFAYHAVLRIKHTMACRRPHEHSPQVQPLIAVPNHGTWPSGHATEAFTFAYVLSTLLKKSGNPVYANELWAEQMMRLAARIAINRTVAGVHFPIDSVAGCMLGLTLGQYFVARCTAAGQYTAWHFNGPAFAGDFNWRKLYSVPTGQTEAALDASASKYVSALGAQTFSTNDGSSVLNWLWEEATKEWAA